MSNVKFSGLPGGGITPAHTACWNGFRELVFVDFTRCGRRLPDALGRDGKVVTGPWRYSEYREGTKCTVVAHQHVTTQVIAMHLSGQLSHGHQRAWLQCYAADTEGMAVYSVVDLDVVGANHCSAPEHYETQEAALEDALKSIGVLQALGLTAHLEVTKSYGYRVWVFHHKLPAAHAQGLGRLIVVRAGLHPKTEISPAQAYLSENQVGSAVFVPYNQDNARHGRQVMIDSQTGDVRMVNEFVVNALEHRSDPARVEEIVSAATESGELKPPVPREGVAYDGGSPLAEPGDRATGAWMQTYLKCTAIREIVDACDSGVEISYGDWLHLASHMKPYGEMGRQEFHSLSSTDPRYDEGQTDALLDSINAPTRCENMGCGRHPQTDCAMAEGKVSAVAFGYEFLRRVPVVNARPARFPKR